MNKKIILLLLLASVVCTVKAQDKDMPALAKLSADLYERQAFDSSLLYSEKLLVAAEKNKSVHYQVDAWCLQGMALNERDKTKEAVACFYKGLALGSDTTEKKLKASIYNQLGAINSNEKNYTSAKGYFRDEIKLRRLIGDSAKTASCLINLSSMHRRLKEIDSSGILLNLVVPLIPKTNVKLKGYYFNARGAHFKLQGDLDSAAFYFNESIRVWDQLGNKDEELRPLFNLGLIYQLKKDLQKALVNYLQAKQITDDLQLFDQKVTVYGNLAELYYDLKDYKTCADYFRRYIELNDSLRQNELKDYGLQLEKQYKIEKNEIINQQKTEIAEQTQRIEAQNRRIFFSVLAIILIASVLVILLIYSGFKKRLAARIEEAKQKFFANVVHEIRTPLSMIHAPLVVLKPRLTSAEDREHLELAERNISRLNELVTQMLDISKLDSDKYVLSETFGDLDIFFRQIVDSYEKFAAAKHITLAYRYPLEKKLAFFDKDAIAKITGNLLDNAIKYTPEHRQVGLTIDGEETESGLKLIIQVWDTGIGISENDQSQIFSRFYRSSSAENARGVGIGLSLVKDLVDLQHGSIELSSHENKGSAFTVTLLLRTKEELAVSPTVPAHAEGDFQVLLVEDDKDILEFNARYLEKQNYKVLRSANGSEAMNLLEKNLPDIIICDLMMPEMDGLSFLKAVKSDPASDHIPVIILSAKSSPQARMEALQAGAQNYLAKPFLPDELAAVIKSQLDLLTKKKNELQQLISEPEKTPEEKFSTTDPYIQKLFGIVLKHLDDTEFSVEKLADLMAINRSHFQRKVKAMTGLSPSEIIKTIRLEKAKELLLAKKSNVTEVAYQTGFSSQSYFTKCFTQHYKISPTQLLQQNR